MSNYVDNRQKAYALKEKYFLLNQHLLECYKIISKDHEKSNKNYNISNMIKNHKTLISRLQFIGKKKPKTLLILQNFANAREKSTGFAILTSTLNKRKLFSM
tara:strand:- start:1347 stop:1652 length:306 start_codon:yes stop_codon:yes gene_type:complete